MRSLRQGELQARRHAVRMMLGSEAVWDMIFNFFEADEELQRNVMLSARMRFGMSWWKPS